MTVERRRRGDFVRATASVLIDMAPGPMEESARQLCGIAATTCGAARAGLFELVASNGADPRVACLAQSPAERSRDAAVLAEAVTAELLGRALAQGGVAARGDLLIGALAAGRAERPDVPTRFLVLQSAVPRSDGTKRAQAFTEVDRRRLRVLATLVALKDSAAGSAHSSDVLARAAGALAAEPTIDGRLKHMAAFLAEVTHSDHALVWSKQQRGQEMRLRAVHGVPDEASAAVYERSAGHAAMQVDLVELSKREHPSAVATSAIPWLSEILDISAGELGDEAVVTPIRRSKEVVGVAICSAPRGAATPAETAALEKRALLTALADQIALTSEYVRTALSAQQSARRFALLAAIGEISLAKMGMGEMLDAILARVQDHFDSLAVSLYLLGSDRSSVRTRSLQRTTTLKADQRSDARVPLSSEGRALGTLHVRRDARQPFTEEDHETLAQVADQIALAVTTSGRYEIQASLAVLDSLTGLPNRRSADDALDRELARGTRGDALLSVALLDLDRFKAINDTHGHESGDEVLREVARMFKAHVRATDVIARWGGEEFLVLLSGADRVTARRACERLRQAVAQVVVKSAAGVPIPITASVGGASVPDDGYTRDEILAAADAALYRAKNGGRNQLCWAND